MANHYRSVLASGGGVQPTGDAVAADVLTGKTFSNASAVGISGTMPNNGAVSGQATPAQPYTIPAGYHNGSGVVTAAPPTYYGEYQSLVVNQARTIITQIPVLSKLILAYTGGSVLYDVSNETFTLDKALGTDYSSQLTVSISGNTLSITNTTQSNLGCSIIYC